MEYSFIQLTNMILRLLVYVKYMSRV